MSVDDFNLDISLSDDEGEKNNNETVVTMRCAEITMAGKPLKITCRPQPQVRYIST